MKSKEEILRPLIRSIGYSYDNIKDVETGHTSAMLNVAEKAMEEYAAQFKPSGPDKSVDELAKEKYPVLMDRMNTVDGTKIEYDYHEELREAFKAGFLSASPKGKEEGAVEIYSYDSSKESSTFTGGNEKADGACPCLYLDEPCQPHCTCKNGLWSHGCLYCCTYGSLEQRKEKAKWIASKISAAPQPKDTSGMQELQKEIGYIKRNAEKINENTWKVYKDQILQHIEGIESSPLLSTQQGEDEDAQNLMWMAVVSGIRRYENEPDQQKRIGLINELKSFYKLYKK